MRWHLLLPNPDRMLRLFSSTPAYFLAQWWATASVAITASVLALIAALLAAVIVLRWRPLELAVSPLVAVSQSFPLQAIAPLIVLVMGIGFHTKTVIAFVIAFFPMYGACLTALKTTPRNLLAQLAICRAPFLASIRHVRLPAALPAIVSSSKVGFTLAVLGAVVAEFIEPTEGLGHVLLVAQSNYDVDVIYLCISFLIIQGLVVRRQLFLPVDDNYSCRLLPGG